MSLGDEPRHTKEGTPTPAVAKKTHETLVGVSAGRLEALETALGLSQEYRAATGLGEATVALVNIAVLVALDAPPASYASQVASAVEAGVTPEDIVGVLRAVAPQVGGARVVAAAPEIMLALGLTLSEETD